MVTGRPQRSEFEFFSSAGSDGLLGKVPRQGSGWKAAADLLGGRHHLQRLELAARFGEIGTTRGRSTLE